MPAESSFLANLREATAESDIGKMRDRVEAIKAVNSNLSQECTELRAMAEVAETKAHTYERKMNELMNYNVAVLARAEKAEAHLEVTKQERLHSDGDKVVSQKLAEESKRSIETLGDNLSSLRSELEQVKKQREVALSKVSDLETAYKTLSSETARKDRKM